MAPLILMGSFFATNTRMISLDIRAFVANLYKKQGLTHESQNCRNQEQRGQSISGVDKE